MVASRSTIGCGRWSKTPVLLIASTISWWSSVIRCIKSRSTGTLRAKTSRSIKCARHGEMSRGAVGPPSPVSEMFYKAVRDSNMRRRGKHQMRLVLGDPYADWDKIKDREDLGPFVANRDSRYATVVKEEVLAKKHRAFLIMGWGHFVRRNGPGQIERTLRDAGAKTYLIVFGTNATGSYDDLDPRFDSLPRPALVELAGSGPAIFPRCRCSSEEWRHRRR